LLDHGVRAEFEFGEILQASAHGRPLATNLEELRIEVSGS
jgi:hypothetical protein